MFFEYSKLVIECYQHLKKENLLRSRLARPTPGSVKDECLAICKERYRAKDGKCLSEFFGQYDDQKSYLRAIQNMPADKFKPVVNLLKGITTNPEDKIFALVAWLIDLEPRPFDDRVFYNRNNITIGGKNWKSLCNKETQIDKAGPDGGRDTEVAHTKGDYGKPYFNIKTIAVIASAIILIVVVIMTFRMRGDKYARNNLTGLEKCMYWAGDHYEPISCSQQLGDTLVIGFDSTRFNHFKRITRPDTIGRKDIGRVWYIKINGKLEYYTAGGNHPVDPKLRLRPITVYIIEKYLE